ncbi:MAG: UDP-N-acetylmuramoyl-tripeptide--D-alanyl-D-alanine ligase [Robiginitomaculum sp.]|nr:MAG: UDP-N-acetylmuramoyl-tripeptide--D-alanyl-D-alanine ligase [Robiginitomaculum sp.]
MSPCLWTAAEIAKATNGRCINGADWQVGGVEIDSRSLQKNDLFVALQVERDGHDFVDAALRGGAAGSLVSKPDMPGPHVLVANTQKALEQLAMAARIRSRATRIAITGSVGKTSVKEALAQVLRRVEQTHKSVKSYNNQWGVPLSMARMPKDSRWAILEIGTNHPGEIEPLSQLVRPDIALITRIASAHLAGFGSMEAIVREKASLWVGLHGGGTAILPGSGPYSMELKTALQAYGAKRTILFGSAADCDVRIESWNTGPEGSIGRFEVAGKLIQIEAPVMGMHWAEVLAATMAAGLACELNPQLIADQLRQLEVPSGRGGLIELPLEQGHATLIDDSYNANPDSMRAALDTLERFDATRKLALLGEMLELGDNAEQLHADLAGTVENIGLAHLWCAGALMENLCKKLPPNFSYELPGAIDGLAENIYAKLRSGDVLLIKGSNGSGVTRVAQTLRKIAAKEKS